jgi:HSP20 family protein
MPLCLETCLPPAEFGGVKMALTDLVPWGRNRTIANSRGADDSDPFVALQRSMNRIFDDFTSGFGVPSLPRSAWTGAWPRVEIHETGNEVKITADLPGLEEKDIELALQDGVLTLKGEKKSESEGALYSERWHGQFQRSVQLGPEVDPDNVKAAFKNGVLTVALAKKPEAQTRVKRIPIGS